WYYWWRLCHSELFSFAGHSEPITGLPAPAAVPFRDRKGTANAGPVTSVAYGPDGKWIASAGEDGTVKLWDARTSREIRTLKGHTQAINSIAISPDGKHIVSSGYAKLIPTDGSNNMFRFEKPSEVKVW